MKMAKKKIVYSVIGQGQFPVDMLRYDNAIPTKEEDASKIAPTKWAGNEAFGTRTIELKSEFYPTEGRWESFGWMIVPNTLRTFQG
jgi:hypothetical protein